VKRRALVYVERKRVHSIYRKVCRDRGADTGPLFEQPRMEPAGFDFVTARPGNHPDGPQFNDPY
jgi:hypothetical protein